MSRTKFVARVAWSVLFAGALHAWGCSCSDMHQRDLDAGPAREPDVGADVGHDAPLIDVIELCNGSGRAGAHCRSGTTGSCISGTACLSPPGGTVQEAFGLRESLGDDPAHPDYPLANEGAAALHPAPFNAVSGTFCAQQCDSTASADTCMSCTRCSTALTQMPLVAAFGGARLLLGTRASYGADTGLCRLECTWDRATRGAECAAEMTCDTFGSICVESCTSDDECNTNYGVTYSGEVVTAIETAHARTCNLTTGRCEVAAGRAGASVGDACEGSDQCADGVGACLAGGLCAELGCPNPDTSASTCASGRGVCVSINRRAHPQSLCLLGCNTADDCGPGNACNLLGMGFTIGTHTGYCLAACSADDECIATETCTDGTRVDATGATVTVAGQCVPRCTGVGAVGVASGGCAATEMCLADHTGASYGRCTPADHFCGAPDTRSLAALDPECAAGWVCDELLAGIAGEHERIADGHCAPSCASDADCAGATCVTTGALAGLCRRPCTADTDCAAPSVCDAAAGWCVEAPPPPP